MPIKADRPLIGAQDAHRQRTLDWIKAAGGLATAFDVTTKGILHAVFEVWCQGIRVQVLRA